MTISKDADKEFLNKFVNKEKSLKIQTILNELFFERPMILRLFPSLALEEFKDNELIDSSESISMDLNILKKT